MSSVSPVNQLPPEILASIFLLVPSRGIELAARSPHPWGLALVCNRWKDVAFSTPQLWSNITVELDPVRVSKINVRGDALVAAWKLCIQRSGDYPLTITLSASSDEAMAFVPTLLEPLVDYTERWDNITFDFPIDILLPFIPNPDLQYLRLRRLLFRGSDYGPTGELLPSIRLFQNAPLLSELRFHEFLYSPLELDFPWSQITKITVYMNPGLGIHHLLYGLRSMPNLSSLNFWQFADLSSPYNPTTQKDEVVRLPYLRKLCWQTHLSNGIAFFDSICAPQLTEMEFNCMDEDWDPDAIRSFLRRSMCVITSLKLNMTSPYVTTSFLALFPDVESVTLSSLFIEGEIARDLTFDDHGGTFLVPKLKSMVLLDITLGRECHGAFVDMVRSRFRAPPNEEGKGSKLESLRIETSFWRSGSVQELEVYDVLQKGLSAEEMMSVTNQVMGERA